MTAGSWFAAAQEAIEGTEAFEDDCCVPALGGALEPVWRELSGLGLVRLS
ncbi:hypothetical protein ACWGI8_13000 [Streptomyces sp. NPDC054841]